MSTIDAIRTWIKGASEIDGPLWINYLGPTPSNFSIDPLPGPRTLQAFMDGSKIAQYPFAINAMVSTASDAERLNAVDLFQTLSEWMESKNAAAELPTLETGSQALSAKADTWAYLIEQGQSDTGIYQVQCTLEYYQGPPAAITEPEPAP